jgi:hypothetical protein
MSLDLNTNPNKKNQIRLNQMTKRGTDVVTEISWL